MCTVPLLIKYGSSVETSNSGTSLEIVPYSEGMFNAYAAFATRAWGTGCYQATRNYIEWLYQANPSGTPRTDDFLVGRNGETIVGCIHKMRLVWQSSSALVEVPALHNWMVDAQFRTGVGLLLLNKAMRSDAHAFISSAAGELATIYRKLKCQEIQACWYRRILLPMQAVVRYSLNRFAGAQANLDIINKLQSLTGTSQFSSVRVTTAPIASELEQMVAALATDSALSCRPYWTAESFRWRFFHPQGPWHICLCFPGTGRIEAFVIIAVGVHKGLPVARLVEACFDLPERVKHMLKLTCILLKKLGVPLFLIYTAHPQINVWLQQAGWSPRPEAQPSFFYHTPGKPAFAGVAFNASAADFGFEAMAVHE
jgi:hypothetical protein